MESNWRAHNPKVISNIVRICSDEPLRTHAADLIDGLAAENARLREAVEEGVTRIQDARQLLEGSDVSGNETVRAATGLLHTDKLRAALEGESDE